MGSSRWPRSIRAASWMGDDKEPSASIAARPVRPVEKLHHHHDHRSLLEGKGQLRCPDDWKGSRCNVIPVHRDVDHPGRDAHLFDRFDVSRDALRQLDAAPDAAKTTERSRCRSIVSSRSAVRRGASLPHQKCGASFRSASGFFIFLGDLGSPGHAPGHWRSA